MTLAAFPEYDTVESAITEYLRNEFQYLLMMSKWKNRKLYIAQWLMLAGAFLGFVRPQVRSE